MEHTSFWAPQYMRSLAVALMVTGVFALAAYGYTTFKQAQYAYTGPLTINVQGEGKVSAKPDIATFSFGVRAQGADATAAQAAGSEKSNAIINFLKEKGVAEADISTENYSVYEKFRYEERQCFVAPCPGSEPIPDGYEAYQSVTVKVRNLDQSSELIAGVGENGATDISGLNFTLDDANNVKAEARAAAVADAKAKAETLADNLDVRIVKMTSFYEEQGGAYPYYAAMSAKNEMAASDAGAPVLPAGEDEYTVVVNITYQVR